MNGKEKLKLAYRKIEDRLIASVRFQVEFGDEGRGPIPYEDIVQKLREIEPLCREQIIGPGMMIIHYGTYKDKFDFEAGYPVSKPVDNGPINSRILRGGEALIVTCKSPHETMGEPVLKMVIEEIRRTGIRIGPENVRVFREIHEDAPENNVTEFQYLQFDWAGVLANQAEQILGEKTRQQIMEGVEQITMSTTIDERVRWMAEVVERVKELADEEQKYWVLSAGGYPFPANRIDDIRAIYEEKKDGDDVLEAMKEDHFWYEDTYREGKVIYTTKLPGSPEEHENAATPEEKRKFACHNTTVRNDFEHIPADFCICSAGWYRQLWGGIFGKPVRVEVLKTTAWGDDVCSFAIHIPG